MADYEKAFGSMDDPEFRDRVYKAVAESRRQRLEAEGKMAAAERPARRRSRPKVDRAGGP